MARHPITIFARNFRGFDHIEIDLAKTTFLVGDNSSGKSSLLHLINAVLRSELDGLPALDESLSVSRHDYFSPYFNFADVTLGYVYSTDSERYGKIVTITRPSKGEPTVTVWTIFDNECAATIRRHGKNLRRRLTRLKDDRGIEALIDVHMMTSGFSNVEVKGDGAPPPNHPMSVIYCFDRDELKSTNLFQPIFVNKLPNVRHIAPVRGLPEKYYLFRRTIEPEGTHFAAMWQDLKLSQRKEIFQRINRFGEESGLFDNVDVSRISRKVSDSPLVVTVRKGGNDFFLNQVGVGVSQVVPVLVECVFADNEAESPVVLLQQPELHLHPVAQATLGTFFFEMARGGLPIILETHSNFLIDRFRSHYGSNVVDGEPGEAIDAQLAFCENTEVGNRVTIIPIDRDGRLKDPPPSYFEFFLNEISRTMI